MTNSPLFPPKNDSPHADRDVVLTSAIAGGDGDALGELYDRYSPIMLALATRVLGNREEAEDLVHELFIEVWRKAGDYDRRRGTVRTWLLLRLRSRAVDRRRAQTRSRVGQAELLTRPTVTVTHDADDVRSIQEALGCLPIDLRDPITLSYFEGLSAREIAERLGLPIGTVKSRTARALSKLRERLSE